jgi:nucleotide-binding universal stress UspA family protein
VITPFNPVTALPDETLPDLPGPAVIRGERERLEALVARTVRGKGPRVECQVVIGDPFRRITEAAREADAIVMATAGRTGLSHLLIGSVAEKVVRHAPVPVLTVRPGERPARGRTGRRRGRGAGRRR